MWLTVAVLELTMAYNFSGSAPVVGTSTGVLAATGNPVEALTPEPPTKASAVLLTNTPSFSGADPIVATNVAVLSTLTCPV
jgi:hypothetical protein